MKKTQTFQELLEEIRRPKEPRLVDLYPVLPEDAKPGEHPALPPLRSPNQWNPEEMMSIGLERFAQFYLPKEPVQIPEEARFTDEEWAEIEAELAEESRLSQRLIGEA